MRVEVFFKQQDNVLASQVLVGGRALHTLKVLTQLQQVADFSGGIVQEFQVVSSTEIDRHSVVPSFLEFDVPNEHAHAGTAPAAGELAAWDFFSTAVAFRISLVM